jgi:hypothetical protein
MRKLLIVLLALGAIAGFTAGFARLWHFHHHGGGYYGWHRGERLERRVADVCVEAAERRLRADASGSKAPSQ